MKKGDIVTITNKNLRGEPFEEGKAKLIRRRQSYPNPQDFELWEVCFLGDSPSDTVERFIKLES